MKKTVYIGIFTAILGLMVCCGENKRSNSYADTQKSQVDSQKIIINEMNLLLETVNMSLDSIVKMEGGILHVAGESPLTRKKQIQQNIEAYKLILQQQHERISSLEGKLKQSDANAKTMLKTVNLLKQQLKEKDQAILELTEELERRNFDIGMLKKNVSQLSYKVTELENETKVQEEALVAQSDMMNEGYVLIGSTNKLKAAGIISGGSLFKKAKFDASKVNTEDFKKIDIRKVTSFSIPAKKATVLTPMPNDSYTIQGNEDGSCTLVISNPARFWNMSNYLVVNY